MLTIRDFWQQGGMWEIEATAARQAVAEQRRIWLPILEAGVEQDDENVDREVLATIRRLRRLLELKPPDPLREEVEQRRKQTRERVRRYRERRLQQTGPPPKRPSASAIAGSWSNRHSS